MKRRRFIGLIGIGTIGVAAGGYIILSDFEKLIKKIIIEDTHSLKIAPEVITNFMKDAQKAGIWSRFTFDKRELIKWSFYLKNPLFSLPYDVKYRRYRSEIVGLFLLSTSFFQNRMDANRPIRYIALYDPYFRPCSNPFSNLFYS